MEAGARMSGPRPGVYRHFKGNLYQLICTAIHSETLERMAVYRQLYGDRAVWVRPLSMWDERVDRKSTRLNSSHSTSSRMPSSA